MFGHKYLVKKQMFGHRYHIGYVSRFFEIQTKETNVCLQISHRLTTIFFLCFQIQNTVQLQTLPFFGDFATKPSWDPITKAHDKLDNL